ncbi:MAG: YwiC-like family protein, partial [Abditibacteriaceae bacterium]
MDKVVSFKSDSQNTLHLGAPPIPREHGAWVILYAPFLIGLAAAWPPPVLPATLLFVAITGVYLTRHALSILLQKNARHIQENVLWLGIYMMLTAAGGLPLLFLYNRFSLLPLAGLAAFIYLLHFAIGKMPTRNRLWRAQW